MRTHSFYDPTTGLFVGRTFSTDLVDPIAHDQALTLNTWTGHAAIEGRFDHLSQRVDLTAVQAAEDTAATVWTRLKTVNRLRRTIGGQPAADPPAPERVVATAAHVVDYQPPAPSTDHEWNPATRRWQLTAVATAAAADRARLTAELAALEKKTPALLRAVALKRDGALEALTAQDSAIKSLEAQLDQHG